MLNVTSDRMKRRREVRKQKVADRIKMREAQKQERIQKREDRKGLVPKPAVPPVGGLPNAQQSLPSHSVPGTYGDSKPSGNALISMSGWGRDKTKPKPPPPPKLSQEDWQKQRDYYNRVMKGLNPDGTKVKGPVPLPVVYDVSGANYDEYLAGKGKYWS